MTTLALIQVRLDSSRFPRKALADILGHPLIWHVCSRVLQVTSLTDVRLVCPPADLDELKSATADLPLAYSPTQTTPLRWREDGTVAAYDVLRAFVAATADLAGDDWVLRVTGDCPVWRPDVGMKLLIFRDIFLRAARKPWPTWYTADTTCSGWPDGCDTELFPAWMLRKVATDARWPSDHEHPTRYMRRHYPAFVVANYQDEGHLVLSVNYPDDLTRVRQYLQEHPG